MPASDVLPDDPKAQYTLALHLRVRRPAALGPLAAHMVDTAGDDPLLSGRARVVCGWHELATGQRDAARYTTSDAVARLGRCQDPAAQALGEDLLAQLARSEGRYEDSLRHGLAVMDCPQPLRSFAEWSTTMGRLASANERLNRYDEALRWHYRSLPLATASGDAMVQAAALGAAGGLQLSLLNLEDAAALCGQAWDIARDELPGYGWGLAATNWAMVLMMQHRYDEGVVLADTLLAVDDQLDQASRYLRFLLLGELMARAGQAARALPLLEQGLALYPFGPEPPLQWVRAQATLWNNEGQPARALALCRTALDRVVHGKALRHHDDDFDLVVLHAETARAHEALGDYAGALGAQRASAEVEKLMAAATMNARRMTLQIRYELDLAQRERDAALLREQAAAQEQLRLNGLNAQLEAASVAKTRFLAVASHDLRQPLHALGLQLAHLRSGVDGVARVAVEQRMAQTLSSLTQMFDTLLDLSRMDAGVLTPRRQVVALAPLLVSLTDELAPLAESRGLRLALRLNGERHTVSDPMLLETLLRNLLGNALKYTRRGGVLLALRDRGEQLAIEVWDTGVGISAADLERVFDEFYQAADGSPDRSQGLGLGLSIVRRLGDLLGHGLQLDSRPGRGTRFCVQLARAETPAAVPAGTAAPSPVAFSPVASSPVSPGLRVAVIEDDSEVRTSLCALLQRWGHQVHAGGSAVEVLAAAAADMGAGVGFDAVLADYHLAGGQTGDAEVVALRRALGCNTPALVVSGDTSANSLRVLAGCGLPWLSKPLQPQRLRAWLSSCASEPQPGAA